MEIASRLIAKENKDVNNLWYWTTEYARDNRIYPTTEFVPDIMKWMRFSDVGAGGTSHSSVCQFNDHSVSSIRAGGYQASIFLNLKPGKYVIQFTVDGACNFIFNTYVKCNNGKIKYGDYKKYFTNIKSGNNILPFEILENTVMMFQFYSFDNPTNWITMTDIKIREGIL